MAARTTWLYWINVGLWMPAVYILFAGMVAELFLPDLALGWRVAICIALIWLTVGFCNISVHVGVWVSKVGALLKIIVICTLGGAGFYYALKHGMANDLTLRSMQPSLEVVSAFYPPSSITCWDWSSSPVWARPSKIRCVPCPGHDRCQRHHRRPLSVRHPRDTGGPAVEKVGLIAGITDASRILFADSPGPMSW